MASVAGEPSLARPTTSAGIFDRDNQYTYSQDYSQGEDEESDVEDLFAFVPPTTPTTTDQPAAVPLPVPPVDSTEHRLSSVTTNVTSTVHESIPSPSSRDIAISLPSPSLVSEKNSQLPPKFRLSSNDSSFITPSMMEEDSREGSTKMEFDFDGVEDEDSPFPEVRASVSNIDDPDMPAMTLRMWVIGLLLCMISTAMNVFFNFRAPAPMIIPLVLVLISYPFGKFLAFALPISPYRLPRFLGSLEISLNPGPWGIKEHVLVYIMANVSVNPPYAMNAIVVMENFYGIKMDYWFNLVFVLGTQLTGFGLAGLCRRFLVWPASMVWPENLVACTLLNTLHAEDEGTGGITRYKHFLIVFISSFFWFFVPGYLFTALSAFSWICWIVPHNVPVNQLFGISSGMGMSVITFDWSEIAWIGSPLMIPWWAEVHIFTGFVLFYWILTPILYYTNTWQLSHFPITGDEPFDRYGQSYNITRVLQKDDTFNYTAYAEYSPLYLPATFAVTYFLAFMLTTCVLVHTLLYHGRRLLDGIKGLKFEPDDIHFKLMKSYPEVPDWWYLIMLVFFFCFTIIAVEIWHTSVPVWALLLALMLASVYVLPSGFLFAMTGQSISLNLLAQIMPGTLLPGNPVANMVFKVYAAQTLAEATSFVQDLKLGHYIKVPPRATFVVQAVGTVLAAFVQAGVKQWLFTHVPDICQPHQKSHLTCPHNQVFFTASAIWGLIGPRREFGTGAIYHTHLYAMIIGGFLPIPFWLWQRRYRHSWVKHISTPVLLNGISYIPPATGINYSAWFAVGFVFQYLIRKKNFAWWRKYNYVTSAALDSGTVFAVIIIFLALQFPKGGVTVKWWGNKVYTKTADYKRLPLRPIPIGGVPIPLR